MLVKVFMLLMYNILIYMYYVTVLNNLFFKLFLKDSMCIHLFLYMSTYYNVVSIQACKHG